MARSQETFSKKEKEKKRQKKKQEKQLKKDERKANPGGKSFDDMIAYVDEYGQLTSTPPDPSRKQIVNVEDIQIGISRQAPVEPGDLIRTGTVTFFNESKGYGFIKDHDSQESIFVHINGLLGPISENDKVTFETEMGHKGLNAVRVKISS
jgi:cold shock CspA family protein